MKLTGLNNESELIRLVSEGNERAFRKLFDFHKDRLYNYVRRITDNEELAEEIVMDAFLKIWINRIELCEINRFDSYMYTVVRNQAFNAVKRLAHESSIIKELGRRNSECQDCTEETVISNDYKRLLHQAVNKLPAQQKLVYMLSRDQGLKYDEIALHTSLSKNTVKAHLKKAVSTLRVVFTNYLVLSLCMFLSR